MTEAMLGSGTVRIGVMRLQLGPFASERTLLGALGDALVRSGLVAETITSHARATRGLSPSPSPPRTRQMGPFRSAAHGATPPLGAAP